MSLIAFFALTSLFLVMVYLSEPAIYIKTLSLNKSSGDRYPLPVTGFLITILGFIAALTVGVVQRWRWVFWLLLIAFGFSILQVPVAVLEVIGLMPAILPRWYVLTRAAVAVIEFAFAVWMFRLYRVHGVWAEECVSEPSSID